MVQFEQGLRLMLSVGYLVARLLIDFSGQRVAQFSPNLSRTKNSHFMKLFHELNLNCSSPHPLIDSVFLSPDLCDFSHATAFSNPQY